MTCRCSTVSRSMRRRTPVTSIARRTAPTAAEHLRANKAVAHALACSGELQFAVLAAEADSGPLTRAPPGGLDDASHLIFLISLLRFVGASERARPPDAGIHGSRDGGPGSPPGARGNHTNLTNPTHIQARGVPL